MKIIKFIPAVLWMVFIFFLSSQSTDGVGSTSTDRFLILKTFHLIEYAVLFILIFWAAAKTKLSIILAYLYALTDETHQFFIPGRHCRFHDTLIDLLGIFIGYFIYRRFLSPLIKRLTLHS